MFWKIINISGWIIGVFGSVIGYISYIDSDQNRLILYDTKSEIVWRQTRFFPIKPILDDKINLESNVIISKTLLTIWNGSKNIVKADDLRVPLKISFSEGSLYDAKIFDKVGVVVDNFSIERKSKNELIVNWKIFDPGMALQIALLHNGAEPRLSITSALGPQTIVRRYTKSGTVSASILIFSFVLSILIGGRFVIVGMEKWLTPVIKSRNPASKAGLYIIFGVIAAALVIVFGTLFIGIYISNMFGDIATPISMNIDY